MLSDVKITEPFSDEYKAIVQDARVDNSRQTLKKQMRLKFQGLSADHEAIIDAADAAALDKALELILSADTPDEVLS
ncbi:MAG: hypothetical protein ACE366_22330 [Bradymonadia bacterium]